MISHADDLHEFCVSLLEPPPPQLVYEWAEDNVMLPERSGALPGHYSTNLTPYVREPLQAFADNGVTDLTLCFGTQTAKTTIIMTGISYRIANDPMNCLWVMPAADLAKSFSKNRWIPMVEGCPAVAAERPMQPNGKVNRYLFGFMEQQYRRMVLNFVGSNSAAQLASRPAGLLALDEVDKFQLDDDREAGALQNAEERTKTFAYPFRVKTSTPTTVHGEIWKEFLLGDQRYFHLPCPHCSKKITPSAKGYRTWEELSELDRDAVKTSWITLKFTVKSDEHGNCGVRWWREDEGESKKEDGSWDYRKVKRNAFYKCQNCAGEIYDSDKPAMLRQGIWVPTNENAQPGRRSYHLNSLYSLLGVECTFGSISVKWLQTRGSMTKRHAFINSTLAETWDDERSVDDRPILLEQYDNSVLPAERTTIMTVDCQESHYWVIIRAWGPPTPEFPMGQSWLLLADRIETEEELAVLQTDYSVDGVDVVCDMANKPNQVAAMIVRRGWRGMWGSPNKKSFPHRLRDGSRVQRVYSEVNFRDPHLGTKWQDQTSDRARFVYWAGEAVHDTVFSLRHTSPVCWHMHANAHEKYQRHLNAMLKTTKFSWQTGRTVYYWKQLYDDNHLLDCECMQVVRAIQRGLLPVPEENSRAVQESLGL